VTLDLGGKIDMPQINLEGKPLTVSGKVARITDGEFVVTGPMATGTRVRMGRTAVLDTGLMQIVISERRSEPFDLGVFTHCGIDPRRKRYVLIKSRQHFRAGFEPIARHIVLCDGEGVTSSDLALFTYKNRRRPLYPFESI
jgi:microcystin degradation protein MlrC